MCFGCKNCEATTKFISIVAEQAEVEIALEQVADMAQIMSYRVMSTPGAVVDGKVVPAGGLPAPEQLRSWLIQS